MNLLIKQNENCLDLLNYSCSLITYTFHLLFQIRLKSGSIVHKKEKKNSKNTHKKGTCISSSN